MQFQGMKKFARQFTDLEREEGIDTPKAIEENGRMANFTLMVSYDTRGPWIDAPLVAPNITCSQRDS